MSYNIGAKIGIEGEAEFRRSIQDINAAYKTLQAETKAVVAAFDAAGDEQGKLSAETAQYGKAADLQRKKVALLEDAVAKATEKYGQNSKEANRLQGALYDAQAEVSGLEAKMNESSAALDKMSEGLEDVGDSAEEAGEDALEFGDILGATFVAGMAMQAISKAADLLKDFAAGSLEAAADVAAAGAQFEQTFGDMQAQAERTLQAISDDTGIAVTRMRGDMTKMYAFMQTAGAEAEDAMDLSGRALMAAADSAAYFDKSIEEATEQLQSFLKGNYANDAALGISATETTRNAKANELYAKSFNELSESQKVETLLAMVEAGNKASGAIGQAARESSSWTNVTGELAEAMRMLQAEVGKPAIRMLTPMVQDLTKALYELLEKSPLDELTEDMQAFGDATAAAEDAYDRTAEKTAGATFAAQKYVEVLEDLERDGLKTAEAQQLYATIVGDLNNLMPELNLQIDEQTGLLRESTDTIYRSIEALKEKALFEARQEKYTAILQEQGKAMLALEEAQADLALLQKEGEGLQEELNRVNEKSARVMQELATYQNVAASTSAASYNASSQEVQKKKELEEQSRNLGTAYLNITRRMGENEKQQRDLQAAIEEGTEAVSAYDDELKGMTSDTKKATEENQKLVASSEEIQASLDELNQAYADAEAAARESIDKQIGLFDDLSEESEWTAEKIIANWESQQEAFTNYTANLQAALDMGLDQTLVQQLSDGSVESMQILDALVNSTDYDIDEINASFERMEEARESVASAMGSIQIEFDTQMEELKKAAREGGYYIIDGMVVGINEYQWMFSNAMSDMGKRGLASFNRTMDINSPSRKMEEAGHYTVAGAVNGVDNQISAFERSMGNLATAGQVAFLQHQATRADMLPSAVAAPYMPGGSVSGSRTENNFGGFSIQIYQQPGESGQDLADRVMDAIQTKIDMRRNQLC